MALGNIFKKQKKEEHKAKLPNEEKPVKAEKQVKIPLQKVKKDEKPSIAYRVLKAPHVTEKASDLAAKNQYVFEVFPRANKKEIRQSVESLFGVNVVRVSIVNVPRKKRRLGRIEGFKSGYKKAIVRIKEGQAIEVLPR